MNNLNLDALEALQHSPMRNYILPGLDSHLVGATTRVFRNTRHSIGMITPHSHRYDFQCLVLRGSVVNTLYRLNPAGDLYQVTDALYKGRPGQFKTSVNDLRRFSWQATPYGVGSWYGMTHDQIHSISFSDDAVVLFIEGEQVTDSSVYIEPHVGGEVVETMRNEPWMFRRE